jgi:hypothetical protein
MIQFYTFSVCFGDGTGAVLGRVTALGDGAVFGRPTALGDTMFKNYFE